MTMEPTCAPTPIETLLAHEAWLRRIIVELVDEQEADDILQETWAAALRSGPLRLLSARGWLRRVAENLARQHHRRSSRRRKRETMAAQPEESAPAADIVARLQAHQRVAQAVTSLPEPYRTAVLLRFFEDLPPRSIARRLGLPGSTVRTRIERGLQMLRGRLESGDVRALAALILTPRLGEAAPAAGLGAAATTLATHVTTMASTHKAASAAVLIALFGLGAWGTASIYISGPDPAAAAQPVGARSTTGAAAPEPAAIVRHVAMAEPAIPAADRPKVRGRVRGRVLDPKGAPLAAVPLVLVATPHGVIVHGTSLQPREDASAEPVATSGDSGAFTFTTDLRHGQLLATGGFVTIRTFLPPPSERERKEALVIAARRIQATGTVVDWLGLPISGVTVAARLDGLVAMDIPLDHASERGLPATVTDRLGRFTLADLPHLPELALEFHKDGYRTARRYELEADAELRIELRSDGGKAWRVHGTVVDEAGRLVPGATVFFHQKREQTGRFGEFSIESRFLTAESRLLAGLPGRQIAARPDLVAKLLEKPHSRITDVVLRLGGPALAAAGQILASDGQPVPGMVVTLLDARTVSTFHTVEDFVAGKASKLANIGKTPAKIDARTDADGRFRLDGLQPRTYRLRIFDPGSLAGTTVTVEAGTEDLIVRLPPADRRTIQGIVHGKSGAPIAGVRVTWGLATFRSASFSLFAPGGSTETDAGGHFTLAGIPPGDAELSLGGPSIVDRRYPLRGLPDAAEVRIETLARCRFRVEIEAAQAQRIRMLDGAGEVLELKRRAGQISYSGDSWSVKRHRTPVLEVSEAAHTLVILSEDRELARHRVVLDPSRVEVLRH
jgi:RNA polymerase sigma-70 factor (ECF subfamily)